MNEGKSLLIIGGDIRQLYMAELLKKSGFDVRLYGLPQDKAECESDLKSAIKSSGIIVLPLPVTKDEKKVTSMVPIKESFDEILNLISGKIVFGGMISKGAEGKLKKNGNTVYDYFRREDVTMLNAVPTVQGILKNIFENIEYTIHSSNCAVFGFGRIGRLTASALSSLGANVTVCVRKSGDIAAAKVYGYKACYIRDFCKTSDSADIIVNTIPYPIIDKPILALLKKECLIIDVASAPFGVDFAYAKELGINALQCSSLPGKVAPKTAGEIIGNAVINTLNEEGIMRD